ncbi:MAG: Ni/Fe hydrogenase subunit alpha [Trueperaceae bacterium]|nr:MAG: Ni/Fe hydrogenase subunit alpha [Trueperaceae bacterium]
MPQSILIDPVTRIEGHAKITVRLDDDGAVQDARFHVTEFRGFEAFCRGRPVHEMPALTARTCGICPVSHVLTGAKAGDAILAVEPPPTARRLRRMMNLGQILQSHALSFFHLSAPDLLLGFDSDPAKRNVFGLIAAEPEIARRGIRMRRFGQEVIAALGGRKIHPAWAVPGGVRGGIDPEMREKLRAEFPTIMDDVRWAWDRYGELVAAHPLEVASFGVFPSLYLGLVSPDGTWEHHEGLLRFIDANGERYGEDFPAERYDEFIGEVADADTYLKSPYHIGAQGDAAVTGEAPGTYRVGPLARINLTERMGTPLADAALKAFRDAFGRIAHGSFHYHGARLIEIMTCAEQIGALLDDPELDTGSLRATAGINRSRGVGVSEAPRGTLFHDYRVDSQGLMTGVKMIIATGHNNLAMNRTIAQIAKAFVKGPDVAEGALNRIEAGIRAYDPCLSCSTHAVGQMPLVLRVESADGELLREVVRG